MLTMSNIQPDWKRPLPEMTTQNRLITLTHEETELVSRVLMKHKNNSPYDAKNRSEEIEVVIAKLHLGPTHQHQVRGTELRLVGRTRRKGDDNTLAIYETPCRIVYVMPEAEFIAKTVRL
jgi:hypothetical protein